MDKAAKVLQLKQKLNAVILAHYYQYGEIQDVADYVGDSLGLAMQAAKTTADVIVFAGVHFMAETAKVLNPDKKVLLPDLKAGCTLADNCPADKFAEFLKQYPDHYVITYVNCSAEVKAMSDLLCTSSNAVNAVLSVPEGRGIVFAPDQHLGRYVAEKTGRDLVLWPGSCIVHETFSERQIVKLKVRYPVAKIVAHPECPAQILTHADYIGSTSGILKYVVESTASDFIVITEPGIIHQMEQKTKGSGKRFIPAPAENGCGCNDCPYMKLNTLDKLIACMENGAPEVNLPAEIITKARIPLERMLAVTPT